MRELLSGPQSGGSTKLSKESTVLLWMLFKRVGRPAPHRKVCALEFDVTRSEVFPEVVTENETTSEKLSDRRAERQFRENAAQKLSQLRSH